MSIYKATSEDKAKYIFTKREIMVDSACSGPSKLPCCGWEASSRLLRSPRECPFSSSGIPGGDHEVIHPSRFQGHCDETYLSEVPEQVKGGSDRWPGKVMTYWKSSSFCSLGKRT